MENQSGKKTMKDVQNSLKIIKQEIETIEKYVFTEMGIELICLPTLSVRSKRCLNAAEIVYLEELQEYSKRDLLRFRNFGNKSITEIEDLMKEYGMKLKDG